MEEELVKADLSELKLTGVLSYDWSKKMSKEELLEFIKRDTVELARKFVSIEWQDAVHVQSEYFVIDNTYNIRETVCANLVYTHIDGASGNITVIKKHKK